MNVSLVRTTFPVQDMNRTGLLVSPRVASANTDRMVRVSFLHTDMPEPGAARETDQFQAVIGRHHHFHHHQYQGGYQRRQEQEQKQERGDWWRSLHEADGDLCSYPVAGHSQYERTCQR